MPRTGIPRASAVAQAAASSSSRSGSMSTDPRLAAPYRAGSMSAPPVSRSPSIDAKAAARSDAGDVESRAIAAAPCRTTEST